jgi:hypothetical protein
MNRTVPYSVYDMDDKLLYSSFSWNEIAAVNAHGCFPDIDYSLLGKCSFSGQNCEGCLKDIDFKITSDSTAEKLAGKCKNITNLEREGSYNYTLLMAGFESRHDADDYLDANRAGLIAQMRSQCAGASWHIVGKCECSDENCEQCIAVDGSISIKCADEIENCYEKGGTYYKTARLADGQGFSDFMEASQYLTDHSDELEGELDEECPDCEDGKYYGVHIWPDWHDGVNGGSCYYGFPYAEVWGCSTIKYYRENPTEMEMMYGEGATFEVVTGPFDDWFEVWNATKKFRANCNCWYTWRCPEQADFTDYVCLSLFKNPGYRGGGQCLGGGIGCRYGAQRCTNFGSRKVISVVEDPSCRRC